MAQTQFKKTAAAAALTDYVGLGIDENGAPYIIDENGAKTLITNAVSDKGWFATEAALNLAYPTADDGDWAIVGSTDTVWVWDTNTTTWVDSGASSSSFLSEVQNAPEKTTLEDTDKIGIVDVTGIPVTKWASFLNFFNSLKTKFDQLYNPLITDSDDIEEGASNKYNKIPLGGTAGQVLTKNSANALDVKWTTPAGASPNIIANQGVGLYAARPVTGLVVGDIYVTTDTKVVLTAISPTTYDSGVPLVILTFINDTKAAAHLLYQYDGTSVELTGDGQGSGGGDMAAEIAAAPDKPIPVDADEVGITDSAAGGILKSLTWANIKATLKTYFDTLYTGDDGGGHTIEENGIQVDPQQTALNFISKNGVPIVTANAAEGSSDIAPKFDALNDVDISGTVTGAIAQRNAGNDGVDFVGIAPNTNVLTSSQVASADGELFLLLKAGYRIAELTATEHAGASAGNISIGSTSLGTDIVSANAVGASAEVDLNVLKPKFSNVNDTPLYISSSAWGAGEITLYMTVIKVN